MNAADIYCMIYKCRNVSCFSAHIKPLRILFSVSAKTHTIITDNMHKKHIYIYIPATSGSANFCLCLEKHFFLVVMVKKTPLQRKTVVKNQPEKSVRQKMPFDRQKTPFGWQQTPFQL